MAMDFDRLDRQLAAQMAYQGASLKEQKAARKAQDSYNKKRLELERQGLSLQADQIAKQYAMDQAKLEWDKESFRQQFGEQQFQNQWQREFDEKQQALDETWRTAEQTGFRDGVPTLENLKFNESTRQFDVQQGNNERDFGESVRRYDQDFGEQQRQFNTKTVMDAPRGPADWAAYQNRLRGLQNSGSLMFGTNPVASFSNGGQQTGPVLSNTDLALAMTGQGNPAQLQGTPWQGMAPRGATDLSGGSFNVRASGVGNGMTAADTQMRYGATVQQEQARSGQPNAAMLQGQGSAGIPTQPRSQERDSLFKTNSSNPYGEGPSSSSNAAANALGVAQPQQPQAQSQSALSIPSLQRYRKFAPTEQQMGLGELEEAGIATPEDAQYQMERQAPQYARSRSARMQGV